MMMLLHKISIHNSAF